MKDTGWRVATIVMGLLLAVFGLWANSLQTKVTDAGKKADTLMENIAKFQATQSRMEGYLEGIVAKLGVQPPVNTDSIIRARVDSLMAIRRPQPLPLPSR